MAASRAILSTGTDGIESYIGVREPKSVDVQKGLAVFRVRSASGAGPDAPDFPVPISAILPNRAEDTVQFWQMLVDSLMELLREQNQYPDFLRGYEVSIGEDSSGEPGLYITLKVARQQSYQASTVRRWNTFSSLLLDLLLRLEIQRYPYIRLQEKRGSR